MLKLWKRAETTKDEVLETLDKEAQETASVLGSADEFLADHQPCISHKFFRHPVTMVNNALKGALTLAPFFILALFVTPSLTTPIEQTLVWATLILMLFFVIIIAFTDWRMNVSTLNEKTLIVHKFTGIQVHSHEEIDVTRINTFDLKKEGFMPYLFDMADIELASIISVDENSTSMMIPNLWKAEKKIEIIKEVSFKAERS